MCGEEMKCLYIVADEGREENGRWTFVLSAYFRDLSFGMTGRMRIRNQSNVKNARMDYDNIEKRRMQKMQFNLKFSFLLLPTFKLSMSQVTKVLCNKMKAKIM